jgi:hypothetical protein
LVQFVTDNEGDNFTGLGGGRMRLFAHPNGQ